MLSELEYDVVYVVELLSCPIDLCFVVDSSGSIEFAGFGNWNITLSFIVSVVQSVVVSPTAAQIGMVIFSNEVTGYIRFSDFPNGGSALFKNILAAPYLNGQTNLADGLETAETQIFGGPGARSKAVKIIIIITDGADNVNPQNTLPNVARLKSEGYSIITIGVTVKIDVARLQQIASSPAYYFNVTTFSGLALLLTNIQSTLCQTTTTTTMTPPTVSPPGRLLSVYVFHCYIRAYIADEVFVFG